MKVRLGEQEYEVEPEVLDYAALKYGKGLLEMYDKLDNTIAFAAKIITKQVVAQMLDVFKVEKKLPRGTDPTEFLIRAYTLLMRESLKLMVVDFTVDEEARTIVDMAAHHENTDVLMDEMRPILEALKHAGGSDESRKLESDQDRTRPKLVAGGQEAQWQDDGGEAAGPEFLPVVS